MSEDVEVELVQHMILFEAADIANKRLMIAAGVEGGLLDDDFLQGEIFRADPVRSQSGGYCLSLDSSATVGRSPELIEALHEIGRGAIFEALTQNRERLVGLIIGEAKMGRDYFARFPTNDGQLKLF